MAATPTTLESVGAFLRHAVRVDRAETSRRTEGVMMRIPEPTMLNLSSMIILTLIPSSHLPHGEFGNWLKENWEMEQRQAYTYMEIAMLKTSLVLNQAKLD